MTFFSSLIFQCAKTFLTLMSKLFKQQTLRYLLTLMDESLRVYLFSIKFK
jgi:hypothetical protein